MTTSDNDTTYKRCSNGDNCVHPDGCLQPNDLKHFRPGNHQCKKCMNRKGNDKKRERMQNDPEYRELIHGYKKQWHEENRDEILQKKRQYWSEHSDEINERRRQEYPQKRDRIITQVRLYKSENYERVLATKRRSYWNNPEANRAKSRQWQANNREYAREQKHTYRRTPQGRLASKIGGERYRVRKLGLLVEYTQADWLRALDWWEHKCAYCGEHSNSLAQEHVVPVSKGGAHVPQNIVPACKHCNSSKRSTDAREWLVRRFDANHADETIQRIDTFFRWLDE